LEAVTERVDHCMCNTIVFYIAATIRWEFAGVEVLVKLQYKIARHPLDVLVLIGVSHNRKQMCEHRRLIHPEHPEVFEVGGHLLEQSACINDDKRLFHYRRLWRSGT